VRRYVGLHTYGDQSIVLPGIDPLWSTRPLMKNFLNTATSIAVPIGAMTLDEATLPSRAKNRAISYIPSKPNRYGIRYYMVASSKYQYIFNFFDNGRGNRSKLPIALLYANFFSELRVPLECCCTKKTNVAIESAGALWSALCLHTTKKKSTFESSGKHRYLYLDNYYTRHSLAKKMKYLTGEEILTTGTVKSNLIDPLSKRDVQKGIKLLNNSDKYKRGSWLLVAV